MGLFIACCIGVLAFFNPLADSFNFADNIFKQTNIFIQSLFVESSLPTKTKKQDSYTLALVGDSMTHYLADGNIFRDALKKYYPKRGFGILNMGIGSTNILTVPDRLEKESKRGEETLPPILSTRPEIIFLESFGNNPLSQFPLKEGLKKQTDTLDKIVKIIKEKRPQTVLVFVATIAPTKERYAEGVANLLPEQRKAWAEERIAYIKNHIDYAKMHKIPLINIFERSLNEKGDGNIDYINSQDFIHPSVTGIQFISETLAEEVFKQKIIPE